MWLRDGLGKELGNARVHIYGYNSTLEESESAAKLEDYTREFSSALNTYLSKETIVGRPHTRRNSCVLTQAFEETRHSDRT